MQKYSAPSANSKQLSPLGWTNLLYIQNLHAYKDIWQILSDGRETANLSLVLDWKNRWGNNTGRWPLKGNEWNEWNVGRKLEFLFFRIILGRGNNLTSSYSEEFQCFNILKIMTHKNSWRLPTRILSQCLKIHKLKKVCGSSNSSDLMSLRHWVRVSLLNKIKNLLTNSINRKGTPFFSLKKTARAPGNRPLKICTQGFDRTKGRILLERDDFPRSPPVLWVLVLG